MDTFFIEIPCQDDIILTTLEIIFIVLIYKNKAPKIEAHTSNSECFSKISGSIEALEILLGKFGFVRVDSGVLANLNHFSHFNKTVLGDIFIHFNGSEKKILCSRGGYTKAKKILEDKSPGE